MATESPPAERKSATIMVQVTPSYKEALEAAAAKEDRSASGFMRFHIGKLIGVYEEDTEESAA